MDEDIDALFRDAHPMMITERPAANGAAPKTVRARSTTATATRRPASKSKSKHKHKSRHSSKHKHKSRSKAKAKPTRKPEPKPKASPKKAAAAPRRKRVTFAPLPKKAAASASASATKPKRRRGGGGGSSSDDADAAAAPRRGVGKRSKGKASSRPPPPLTSTDANAYTVPAGKRKSKVRHQVPVRVEEVAVASVPVPAAVPVAAVENSLPSWSMPDLDSWAALDDWAQRYRNSAAHTAPIEMRRLSVAEAIRASFGGAVQDEDDAAAAAAAAEDREEDAADDAETDLGLDGGDPADAALSALVRNEARAQAREQVVQEAETKEELTIEEFFSGDVKVPYVGYAVDMNDMLVRLREEIDRHEALAHTADGEAQRDLDDAEESVSGKQRAAAARQQEDREKKEDQQQQQQQHPRSDKRRKRSDKKTKSGKTSSSSSSRRKNGKPERKRRRRHGRKEGAAGGAVTVLTPTLGETQNNDAVMALPSAAASIAATALPELRLVPIEACSRAYCSDFFREGRGEEFGERSCRRGAECVFVIIAARYPDTVAEATSEEGFVCREFLRPSQLDQWKANGELPPDRQVCLGCNRMITSFLYYKHKSCGETPTQLIQDHYNRVDEPGEYDLARCLHPNPDSGKWTGIAYPFMEFAPNTFAYVVFELTAKVNARKWHLLGAEEIMTDFRLSPSTYDRSNARAADGAGALGAQGPATATRNHECAIEGEGVLDPRAAWVSRVGDAVLRGVPPVRPLRTPEWVAAEAAACPPAPGFGPVSTLLPRLVLGRLFPDYPLVFCQFGKTVAAARARPSTFALFLSPDLTSAGTMYSFDASVLLRVVADVRNGSCASAASDADDDDSSDSDDAAADATSAPAESRFRVLLSLLYRVHAATRLMRVIQPPAAAAAWRSRETTSAAVAARTAWVGGRAASHPPASAAYWLQLFIDTHIELALGMHATATYDDAGLNDIDRNPTSIGASILKANFPHDARAMHCGDLPDLSACIQFASVWFQVRAKTTAESVADALIHLVAVKTQTHKCQVRNFAQIAFRFGKDYPQIMPLFRALLSVSLLGNYPHARFRPDFAARLHIVHSVRRVVCSDRELFLYLRENEQFAYGVVKEYYRYLVAQRPAFEAVLEETTRWAAVRDCVGEAMDQARSVAALAPGNGTPSGRARMDAFFVRVRAPAGQALAAAEASVLPVDPQGAMVGGNEELHGDAVRTISADMHALHEVSELPLITKMRKALFSGIIVPEMRKCFKDLYLKDHVVRPQSSLMQLAELDGSERAAVTVRAIRLIVERRVPRHDSCEPLELGWLAYLGVSSEGLAALRAMCYDYETKDIADNSIMRRIRSIHDHAARDFFVMHTFFEAVEEWRAGAGFSLPRCYAESQAAVLRAKTFTPPYVPLPPGADLYYMCQACHRWLSDVVVRGDPDTRENRHSMNFKNALYSYDTGKIYCGRQKVSVNTRKQVESGRYSDPDAYVEDVREARKVRHYLSTPLCCSVPATPVHMLGWCQRLGGKLYALCECCAAVTQWGGAGFGPVGFTCGFEDPSAPRIVTAHQQHTQEVRERRTTLPPAATCSYCHRKMRPGEDFAQVTVIDDCGEEFGDHVDPPSWKYLTYVLCVSDAPAVHTSDVIWRRSVLSARIERMRKWRFLANARR